MRKTLTKTSNSVSSKKENTSPVPQQPAPAVKLSKQRLDPHKLSNPFSEKKKYKTAFGNVYDKGTIPCRIQHSAVKMTLQWHQAIEELSYDPLLLYVAEGLRETEHPYVFVARSAFKDLISNEAAKPKILPLLDKVVSHVRLALQSASAGVFDASLGAIEILVTALGKDMLPFLGLLLVPMSKKWFDKNYKTKIVQVLQTIEQACGPESVQLIKQKVPTYISN